MMGEDIIETASYFQAFTQAPDLYINLKSSENNS